MISREETAALLKRMAQSRPKKLFHRFDDTNAGIGCVVRYLSDAGRPVSAGEISQFMNVSTARVAVLLRKMDEKGLIVRNADPDDARKTMISLSEKCMKNVEEHKGYFLDFFSSVIERMGRERFEQFIELSEELRDAFEAESQNINIPEMKKNNL